MSVYADMYLGKKHCTLLKKTVGNELGRWMGFARKKTRDKKNIVSSLRNYSFKLPYLKIQVIFGEILRYPRRKDDMSSS
jgi:hypothetical protein